MLLAVNMPEHEPQVGQAERSILASSSLDTLSSLEAIIASMRSSFRTPPGEPDAVDSTLPASIGPPDTKIAGMLSRMAASNMPGVILSQFEMHTSASAQCALTMYSTLSAMSSRLGNEYSMPVWPMAMPSSMAIVSNSTPHPPAWSMTFLTRCPTSCRCTCPGTNCVKLLAMATIGLSKSESVMPVARQSERAPAMLRPCVEVRLRYPVMRRTLAYLPSRCPADRPRSTRGRSIDPEARAVARSTQKRRAVPAWADASKMAALAALCGEGEDRQRARAEAARSDCPLPPVVSGASGSPSGRGWASLRRRCGVNDVGGTSRRPLSHQMVYGCPHTRPLGRGELTLVSVACSRGPARGSPRIFQGFWPAMTSIGPGEWLGGFSCLTEPTQLLGGTDTSVLALGLALHTAVTARRATSRRARDRLGHDESPPQAFDWN